MFARFAIAAPSIAPPIPTITYGSLTGGGTQITATIDNYSTDYSYVVTSTVGSVSRSGANITVTGLTTNTSVNLVVIATSARGLSTPSSAITDRQPYTYRTETRTGTRVVDTTSCYPASPGPTCPFGGVPNVAGTECCVASSYTEEYTFEVQILNPAPSGYLDSGFDWYKVSNVTIERIQYTYYTETYSYTYPCTVTCTSTYPCPQPCFQPGVCCSPGPPLQVWQSGGPCWISCSGGGNTCPGGWSCSGPCSCSGCGTCVTTYFQPSTICNQCTVSCPPIPQTCTSSSPCPGTCTGTGTRQVRNPTPSGYTDSGVDWYRFV